MILSKLDCADLVFYPPPQFLLRRMQRVQFAAASFVLGPFVKNFRDVLKIGWLPINERRDLNLLKSCFKALHYTETWPDYLKTGAHQMEPPSPIQALGVNPFPSRFIIRTVPRGDFTRRRWEEPITTTK